MEELQPKNVNAGNDQKPFLMRVIDAGMGIDFRNSVETVISNSPSQTEEALTELFKNASQSETTLSGVTHVATESLPSGATVFVISVDRKSWPFIFAGPAFFTTQGMKILYLCDHFSPRSQTLAKTYAFEQFKLQDASNSQDSKTSQSIISLLQTYLLKDFIGSLRLLGEMIDASPDFFKTLYKQLRKQPKTLP